MKRTCVTHYGKHSEIKSNLFANLDCIIYDMLAIPIKAAWPVYASNSKGNACAVYFACIFVLYHTHSYVACVNDQGKSLTQSCVNKTMSHTKWTYLEL